MILLLNKPYGVICQFTRDGTHPTLKDFVNVPEVYPAGRLDTDSEGLLILTDDGKLQHRIASPIGRHTKMEKSYWVQVEGRVSEQALTALQAGLDLGDFVAAPCKAVEIAPPAALWPRNPPIRHRAAIPTNWLDITLTEGKNRQVRRMTAKVGLPTLRLIRHRIGTWTLDRLQPGRWRVVDETPVPQAEKVVNRSERKFVVGSNGSRAG